MYVKKPEIYKTALGLGEENRWIYSFYRNQRNSNLDWNLKEINGIHFKDSKRNDVLLLSWRKKKKKNFDKPNSMKKKEDKKTITSGLKPKWR
jgi:hypothetical protein